MHFISKSQWLGEVGWIDGLIDEYSDHIASGVDGLIANLILSCIITVYTPLAKEHGQYRSDR